MIMNSLPSKEQNNLGDEADRTHDLESLRFLVHDFNNLLNVIYGNITFARMLAGDKSAIVEPLADAEKACERARELGIRLLAFSRMGSPGNEPIALASETACKDSNI